MTLPKLEEDIQKVLDGETGRFADIVKTCEPAVCAVVAAMLPDRSSMQDVVQESFVIAHRRLSTYKPGTSFFAWVRTIAANVARNERRKWYRKADLHERYRVEVEREIEASTTAKAEGLPPETMDALKDCISHLNERARQLVEGAYHKKVQVKELASTLGLSETAAKVALFRARQEIARCLKKKGVLKA